MRRPKLSFPNQTDTVIRLVIAASTDGYTSTLKNNNFNKRKGNIISHSLAFVIALYGSNVCRTVHVSRTLTVLTFSIIYFNIPRLGRYKGATAKGAKRPYCTENIYQSTIYCTRKIIRALKDLEGSNSYLENYSYHVQEHCNSSFQKYWFWSNIVQIFGPSAKFLDRNPFARQALRNF